MSRRATLCVAMAIAATTAAPAAAATARTSSPAAARDTARAPARDTPALRGVSRLDEVPFAHRLTGRRVRAIASRVPKIVDERRKFPGSYAGVFLKGPGRWQVSFYARAGKAKEIGQVIVDDATGAVIEAWTGYQVPWTMARGYPGAFGKKVNAPWIWIPLSVLFVVPFVTPRRPWRMLHLDLLALVGFGVSLAFFNAARIGASTPIAMGLLAYVLVRMLWVTLRRRTRPPEPLQLLVPVSWLTIAIVFLVGFRIGLNVTNSNVIDVGYAGVVGADRLAKGEPVYGAFPRNLQHGDTYGPVVYESYVPFEQAFPSHGRWDDLPAAHGAAIAFDLLCVALLFLIGRMVRGPTLGIVLAYAWLTYPFTLYTSSTNANDALVAALILAALAAAAVGRPAARGGFAALAALSKVAPIALAPVLATAGTRSGPGIRRRRGGTGRFVLGFALAGALALAPFLLRGEGLSTIYDRTIAYQAGRDAPFSVWGLYGLDTLQHVWQGLAVLLAVGLAFVPRRGDLVGLAAACAAVIAALQLAASYWFYLYLVWLFPIVLIALLAGLPTAGEPARSSPRAAAT